MKFGILTFFSVLAMLVQAPASAQGHPNSAAIIGELLPENTGPAVRSMNGLTKRGINIQGQLPPMVDLPSVDLTVNFELDSSKLTTDGMITLRSLAKALHDPQLSGMTFQVAGHTDGRGDAAYNQTLSELRARAVVDHLVNFYELSPGQLIPIGYGLNRPMDAANIMNPLNRRVEIINLEPLS